MYFEDLSPYRYRLPFPLPGVRCVGWLDRGHPYATGRFSVKMAEKLEAAIQLRDDMFDIHVNVVRGVHPCNFCGKDIELIARDKKTLLGMSEIWIPDGPDWLASPSLAIHYMRDHGYLPPSAFARAVEKLSTRDRVRGQEAYDRSIMRGR